MQIHYILLLISTVLQISEPKSNRDSRHVPRDTSKKHHSRNNVSLKLMESSARSFGRTAYNSTVGTAIHTQNGRHDNWENNNNLTLGALNRAIEWTMNQRDAEWGWGPDTPHTVLALSIANPSWFTAKNLESQLVTKQFQIHLILRLWKHRESAMTTGQIALNVMTLVSLCQDPRSFYDKDLINLLEHHEGRVDFEIAFATLASCNSGRYIKRSKIRRLLAMMSHRSRMHSVDTLSIVILALQCVHSQRRLQVNTYMEDATKSLLEQQAEDGSFASNIHSTAIALQALTVRGLGESWNVTRAQEYVMSHQLPDGSFGNLFDTNAVLPIMAGRSLLDVGQRPCEEDNIELAENTDIDRTFEEVNDVEGSGMKAMNQPVPTAALEKIVTPKPTVPEMITMTYIIWIGDKASLHYSETFTVPKNTTFYNIMLMAAERNQHYEFSASKWANGYYVHTLSGQKEKQVGFWFWLLYRLREPPVQGTKPDNKFVVGQGVVELMPNDGDYILYWYHKI